MALFSPAEQGGLGMKPVAELIISGLHAMGHYCTDVQGGEPRLATEEELLSRLPPDLRHTPRLKSEIARVLSELQEMVELEVTAPVARTARRVPKAARAAA